MEKIALKAQLNKTNKVAISKSGFLCPDRAIMISVDVWDDTAYVGRPYCDEWYVSIPVVGYDPDDRMFGFLSKDIQQVEKEIIPLILEHESFIEFYQDLKKDQLELNDNGLFIQCQWDGTDRIFSIGPIDPGQLTL